MTKDLAQTKVHIYFNIADTKPLVKLKEKLKDCVSEVDLQYSKELRKLFNYYLWAPDEIEMKREMLSNYQMKIADFYNIPIGTVKKLVSNIFYREKFLLHYEKF